MIKSHNNKYARLFFDIYLNKLLRSKFSNFYLMNTPPKIDSKLPLVITPNHFSWWDGFFIDFLNTKLIKKYFHIMMLEHQLDKYWFFKYLGAYSINQQNPKSITETANYTKEILHDEKNLTVIYPQGKIEAYDSRPVSLKQGLKYFLKDVSPDVNVLIVSFKIQFAEDKNPFIAVRFGNCLTASGVLSDFDQYEKMFNDNLRMLDAETISQNYIFDLFSSNSIMAAK